MNPRRPSTTPFEPRICAPCNDYAQHCVGGAHCVQNIPQGDRRLRIPPDMPDAPPTRGETPCVREIVSAFMGQILPPGEPPRAGSAADILDAMAATFRERNAVYGSNYKMVAPLVRALFPAGVPSALVASDKWHLFELILVKLSRLAISGVTHRDSIHDMGVYCAMVEHCMLEEARSEAA